MVIKALWGVVCTMVVCAFVMPFACRCTPASAEGVPVADSPKRINLVGWRDIGHAGNSSVVAFAIQDTLSKSEFLMVAFNGRVATCPIPGSGGAMPSVPAEALPKFKSNW